MFTANEFQNIRAECEDILDELLVKLFIEKPDWNNKDEFGIYADLDQKIVAALCKKMKAGSIIKGYANLLSIGGISYTLEKTDNELLELIVNNKDQIITAYKNGQQKKKITLNPAPKPERPRKMYHNPPSSNWKAIIGVLCIIVSLLFFFTEAASNTIVNCMIFLLGTVLILMNIRSRSQNADAGMSRRFVQRDVPSSAVNDIALSDVDISEALSALALVNKMIRIIRV